MLAYQVVDSNNNYKTLICNQRHISSFIARVSTNFIRLTNIWKNVKNNNAVIVQYLFLKKNYISGSCISTKKDGCDKIYISECIVCQSLRSELRFSKRVIP